MQNTLKEDILVYMQLLKTDRNNAIKSQEIGKGSILFNEGREEALNYAIGLLTDILKQHQ